MFALSRWSGGLVARIGSRLPLTVGPAIAAVGIGAVRARRASAARTGRHSFPAVVVLGLRHGDHRRAADDDGDGRGRDHHAGVASGVNNAVARVAGLLAIAVFGRRAGPDVRRAGAARARRISRSPRRPERRSIGSCRRWLAPT